MVKKKAPVYQRMECEPEPEVEAGDVAKFQNCGLRRSHMAMCFCKCGSHFILLRGEVCLVFVDLL